MLDLLFIIKKFKNYINYWDGKTINGSAITESGIIINFYIDKDL